MFTNPRTHEGYTVNGVAHVFKRALVRAGITTGDVSLHTLRHTALSRMIAAGYDDFTVMAISAIGQCGCSNATRIRRPRGSSTR